MKNKTIDTFEDDHARHGQPEQLALFVNLDGFEGPIDLLLNLARDQKLDLKKIAILPLAEQYLQFTINSFYIIRFFYFYFERFFASIFYLDFNMFYFFRFA